jgi:hypothetical protein
MKIFGLGALLLTFFSSPTQAAKILFFGDSHSVATVGPFGIRMNELLRSLPNAEVETHARCGSVMAWWYSGKSTSCGYFDQAATGPALPPKPNRNEKWAVNAPTPKIAALLQKLNPDLVVIEMGGNYTHANNPIESVKDEIGKFITDLQIQKNKSKLDCVWIGLPSRRLPKDPAEAVKFQTLINNIVKTIKEIVEPTCEFIDSTKLTHFPTHAENGGPLHGGKDGVHYSFREGIPIANRWAEAAFVTVKSHYEKITR